MAFFLPKQSAATAANVSEENKGAQKTDVSEENLRERRYLWTARAFAMILFVSLITNILMLMSLSSLVPLVRIQPYELTFADKKTQTVDIQPLAISDNTINVVSESLLRQYIVARHTITPDKEEMINRWGLGGMVELFSSDEVFREFQEPAMQTLEEAFKTREVRSVAIESVMPYYKQGWWLVNLKIERTSPERGEREITSWVATVQVGFDPIHRTWEKRLNNPMGFKVLRYGFETKENFDRREQQRNRE